jgi:LacI family transcriptional regulator
MDDEPLGQPPQQPLGTSGRRPTMLDVAKTAGVSLKTVSRVVNGEQAVSPERAQRVTDAIRALRYVPDVRARDLRQRTTAATSIGFILVDVSNPFFSGVLRGLEEVARKHDCLVLSASSDGDPDRLDQLVEDLLERRVGGMVVVPTGTTSTMLISSMMRDVPVVFLDCEPQGLPDHRYDVVRSDHRRGAAAITQHLINHGHRRIAFLGDDLSVFSANLRYEGFADALIAAGIPPDAQLVHTGSRDAVQWEAFARGWLETVASRPTAIVSAQNFVTIGTVAALHALGLQHQIALVGFDDVEFAGLLDPALSVQPQEPRELGRRAGAILFERLAGATMPPSHDVSLPPFVARGSGELRP